MDFVMAGCGGFTQIVQSSEGTRVGIWGLFELHTAFQPIFRFDENAKLSASGVECLVRPFREGRVVPPRMFFASIQPEDRFAVETLTRNLHILNAGVCLDDAVALFINFDPSQFGSSEAINATLRDMRLVLHEARIDSSRVVCELTEKKSASDEALAMLIKALRAHGFRIAVDDFGAEESDIERIFGLRPDIVKFDADWVSRLLGSASGYALLKSMVNKVTGLGIETVIEGVEESWQLELTEKSGAMMVQGFGVAKPSLARIIEDPEIAIASQASRLREILDQAKPSQPGKSAAPIASTFGRRR